MKIDNKFCFVPFCVVFEEILRSEPVAAEKTARFCLKFTFFFFVVFFFFFFFFFSFAYFLCVGIPILKTVLSHAHKWVIFGGILLKLSFLMS